MVHPTNALSPDQRGLLRTQARRGDENVGQRLVAKQLRLLRPRNTAGAEPSRFPCIFINDISARFSSGLHGSVPHLSFLSNIRISVENPCMGMTCYFVAVSDRDLPEFAAKPSLLLKFGSEIDISEEELEMFGLTEEDADWEPTVKPRTLYVDKAWDGMNFLLKQAGGDTDFPYTFITEGGSEFDDPEAEMGYGPPRAFTPDEVQEIARMLKAVDINDLYEQADPEELEEADVYTFSMDEPKEQSVGYFTHYLTELKKFVQEAAAEKMALIVYLA